MMQMHLQIVPCLVTRLGGSCSALPSPSLAERGCGLSGAVAAFQLTACPDSWGEAGVETRRGRRHGRCHVWVLSGQITRTSWSC